MYFVEREPQWFNLKLNAVITYLACASFETVRRTGQIFAVVTFQGKNTNTFVQVMVLGVAVFVAKTPY